MALSEEKYQEIRENFIKHMETTPPPYRINLSLAYNLFSATTDARALSEDNYYDPMNTAYDIKDRLIAEFCPFEIPISHDFSIEKFTKIDENDNFIYAIDKDSVQLPRLKFDTSIGTSRLAKYFLRTSNQNVLTVLRLAYGNDL